MKRKKRFITCLVATAVIVVIFSLISHFSLLHGLQLQFGDSLFKAAGLNSGTTTNENIVIVAIDDRSLEHMGLFSSWSRSSHAQLIDFIAEAGARVIVFDVLFAEPADGDEELASSIDKAGNVILPYAYNIAPYSAPVAGQPLILENMIKPLPQFEEGALALGHALMLPDSDGIVRRLPLIIESNEGYEPSLALATIAKYLRRSEIIEFPVTGNEMSFAGRSIKLDESYSMPINYTDGVVSSLNFEMLSYSDAVNGDIPAEKFRDKIVVIGVTATALGDTFWTPMGQLMNGVELHASAMQTILSANFLTASSSIVDAVATLLLAVLCALAVLKFRPHWAAVSAVSLCILYFLIAFSLFDRGIMLNMLHPPLALAATFAFVNVQNVVYERAEKSEITRTFGRYLFPPLVDKILEASREDKLELGGNTHEISVMFIDARQFTSLSENIRSEAVVDALNSYLGVIVEAIKNQGGMISNFGGDSIMAIWNVPIESSDHALRATYAAISAQRAIRELQEREPTLLLMKFGIGVNTGNAVAGNMGSEDYLQYSVIGDVVNVAARLTGDAPGGKVWLGEQTLAAIGSCIDTKPLEPLTLKGRHETIQVYEVIDSDDLDIDEITYHDEKTKDMRNKS